MANNDDRSSLPETSVDKSDVADAKRMRWLLSGNGYFLEENGLCGHETVAEEDADKARVAIDLAMDGFQ